MSRLRKNIEKNVLMEERKIDIIVKSLVDFNWYTYTHIHTLTSYNMQMKVNHHFENPVTEMIKMMWMLVSDVSATTSV